jgi:hypothetical protein
MDTGRQGKALLRARMHARRMLPVKEWVKRFMLRVRIVVIYRAIYLACSRIHSVTPTKFSIMIYILLLNTSSPLLTYTLNKVVNLAICSRDAFLPFMMV